MFKTKVDVFLIRAHVSTRTDIQSSTHKHILTWQSALRSSCEHTLLIQAYQKLTVGADTPVVSTAWIWGTRIHHANISRTAAFTFILARSRKEPTSMPHVTSFPDACRFRRAHRHRFASIDSFIEKEHAGQNFLLSIRPTAMHHATLFSSDEVASMTAS